MLILSHRGVHHNVPENTIAAFEQAIAMGADGIETDIRLDRTGVPILFHDRHGPPGTRVSALTRDALSRAVGYDVPTLAGALQCSDRILWNLEIKEAAAVPPTLSVLEHLSMSHQCLITSFHHPTIAAVSTLSNLRLATGLLVCHRPIDGTKLLEWFPTDTNPKYIVWDYETIDPALIEEAKALGILSLVYGVLTQEEHQQVVSWNLHGVITDHPEFLLPRRREASHVSSNRG
jgi:glycerophosphoryl diester phosphodiesterase